MLSCAHSKSSWINNELNTLIIDERASFLASFFASFLSSSSVKFSRKEGTKSCRDKNISSTNTFQTDNAHAVNPIHKLDLKMERPYNRQGHITLEALCWLLCAMVESQNNSHIT